MMESIKMLDRGHEKMLLHEKERHVGMKEWQVLPQRAISGF